MKTYPVNIPEGKRLPEGCIVKSPVPTGEQKGMVTGNWRILRPVVDHDKCTMCLTCYISCPDACITVVDREDQAQPRLLQGLRHLHGRLPGGSRGPRARDGFRGRRRAAR